MQVRRAIHRRRAWWATGYSIAGLALIGWTVNLANLPTRPREFWLAMAWVGLDAAMAALCLLLGVLIRRWDPRVLLVATALVVLALTDALFDLGTSIGTPNEPVAIVMAVLGEVPLAVATALVAAAVWDRLDLPRPGRPERAGRLVPVPVRVDTRGR